jgi:hypothetical protein
MKFMFNFDVEKVTVTLKDRKTFYAKLLQLGVRYCDETYILGSFFEDCLGLKVCEWGSRSRSLLHVSVFLVLHYVIYSKHSQFKY